MKDLIPCEFNMDTACVELKYTDGSMIAFDTLAVENELDATTLQRVKPYITNHLNMPS